MSDIRVIMNEEITTCNGYKEGKNIDKSDCLRDVDGALGKVESISEKGYLGSIVRLKVNGYFNDINLLPDHEVFVYRGKKEDREWEKTRWIQASDLRIGDMVVYKVDGEWCGDSYSKYENISKLLGYYVVEGFCDKRTDNKVVFKYVDGLESLVSAIEEEYRDFYKGNISTHSFSGEKFMTVESKEFYDLCRIFGRSNREKSIPEDIINADIDFVKGFALSMVTMDKDKRDSYFRPSSSLDLFKGFQRIFMRLGSFSNIYSCISKNSKFNYFALVMNETEKAVVKDAIFSSSVDSDRWFRDGAYAYLKITEIGEFSGNVQVCEFETEVGSVVNHLVAYR